MKGELQQQIPALKKDFLYFKDYAGKTIEEVFTHEQLKDVSVFEVEQSQSCLFKNDGNGNFAAEPFPLMAQLSYVFGFYVGDFNNDDQKDIFMAGNFYGLKPQAGRFDASYGTTLLSDGKGRYHYIPPAQSGLFVNGEVRDIKPVKTGGKTAVLVAMNNDHLQLFKN
jgi:hypothetical protein